MHARTDTYPDSEGPSVDSNPGYFREAKEPSIPLWNQSPREFGGGELPASFKTREKTSSE